LPILSKSSQLYGLFEENGKKIRLPICFIEYHPQTSRGGEIPGFLTVRAKKDADAERYSKTLLEVVGA